LRARVHLANISFAKTVEPSNSALLEREASDARLRRDNLPTLPSTIAREKPPTLFARDAAAVIESANKYLGKRVSDPAGVFAALRNGRPILIELTPIVPSRVNRASRHDFLVKVLLNRPLA